MDGARMKWACIAFIACALAHGCAWADVAQGERHAVKSRTTTPTEVLALIKLHGARDAVVLLDKSGGWQASVLPGVASARADWLDVARALHAGTDAGGREELDDALSSALLAAPYSVLPLLQEIWGDDQSTLCTFGWDSELPGGVEQYVRRLRKALQKPPPAQMMQLRDACLRGIEATLLDVRKNKASMK
jgi:hypothetical protein